MSKPGGGRYSVYVTAGGAMHGLGGTTAKYERLYSLFNGRAASSGHTPYDIAGEKDNSKAAELVAKQASAIMLKGVGDTGMFPTGVDMKFGGSPDLSKLPDSTLKAVGGPSNPWLPNLASPGPGVVSPVDPLPVDPAGLTTDPYGPTAPAQVFAGSSTGGNAGVSTVMPSSTSPVIGTTSIGKNLTLGSYIKSA